MIEEYEKNLNKHTEMIKKFISKEIINGEEIGMPYLALLLCKTTLECITTGLVNKNNLSQEEAKEAYSKNCTLLIEIVNLLRDSIQIEIKNNKGK